MAPRKLLVCVALCVALLATTAVAQDDEFAEDVAAPAAPAATLGDAAVETEADSNAPKKPANPVSVTAAMKAKDWTSELLFGAGLIGYLLFGLYTRNATQGEAEAVAKRLVPTLRDEFAKVGGDKGAPANAFSPVSSNDFEVWASGRRHVHGALITLSIKKKLELTSLMNSVLPASMRQNVAAQAGVTRANNTDLNRLSVEIPLADGGVAPCVVAVGSKEDVAALEKARPDVGVLADKYVSCSELGLRTGNYTVKADHRDAARAVIAAGSRLHRLLDLHPGCLAELLLTDFAVMADIRDPENVVETVTQEMSKRVLRATFELPAAVGEWPEFASTAVAGLLEAVDRLAAGPLPADAAKAVTAHRDEYARRLEDIEKKALAAKAKEEKEAADRKAREEKYAKMTREEKRKFEVAEREREKKEQAEKMKRKMRQVIRA